MKILKSASSQDKSDNATSSTATNITNVEKVEWCFFWGGGGFKHLAIFVFTICLSVQAIVIERLKLQTSF